MLKKTSEFIKNNYKEIRNTLAITGGSVVMLASTLLIFNSGMNAKVENAITTAYSVSMGNQEVAERVFKKILEKDGIYNKQVNEHTNTFLNKLVGNEDYINDTYIKDKFNEINTNYWQHKKNDNFEKSKIKETISNYGKSLLRESDKILTHNEAHKEAILLRRTIVDDTTLLADFENRVKNINNIAFENDRKQQMNEYLENKQEKRDNTIKEMKDLEEKKEAKKKVNHTSRTI